MILFYVFISAEEEETDPKALLADRLDGGPFSSHCLLEEVGSP